MRRIRLTMGKWAMVDDVDYGWLSKFNWSTQKTKCKHLFYANKSTPRSEKTGKRTITTMHRLIMGSPKGMWVDHINGDGLDCRRSNLRLSTRSENMRNRRKPNMKTFSKYKGVYNSRGYIIAHISINKKPMHLGQFKTQIEAARAYDKKALEIFGSFAKLNFPIKSN